MVTMTEINGVNPFDLHRSDPKERIFTGCALTQVCISDSHERCLQLLARGDSAPNLGTMDRCINTSGITLSLKSFTD